MINVAIVAFEGISLFHLSVPIAIFKDAKPDEKSRFNVQVCAENLGSLTTSNGMTICIEESIDAIHLADIIIIPSWEPSQTPSQKLISKLKGAHSKNKW